MFKANLDYKVRQTEIGRFEGKRKERRKKKKPNSGSCIVLNGIMYTTSVEVETEVRDGCRIFVRKWKCSKSRCVGDSKFTKIT